MRHEIANAWWRELLPRVRQGALLSGLLLGACAEAPLANGSVGGEVREGDEDDEDDEGDGESQPDESDEGEADDEVERGRGDGGMASRASSMSLRDASPRADDAYDRTTAPSLPDAALDASLLSDGALSLPDAGGMSSIVAWSDAGPAGGALCRLAGSQVAILGDSYLDLSGDIARFLQETARAAGALEPGDSYIDRARSGASMAYEPSIPSQFQEVLEVAGQRRSPGLRLVIMDGGGNDVLVHNRNCLEQRQPNAFCLRVVENSVRTLKKLFTSMAGAGVQEVIYFWYPDLPGGGLGGSRPHVMNGYAAPIMREACEANTEVKCSFIDTRPAFAGHAEYISPADNTHPTAAGSRVIADLIWRVMVDRCVGSR